MIKKEEKIITADEILEMFFDGTSGDTLIKTTPRELKELAKKMILIKQNENHTI
jgi:hypothetical protein